MIGFCTYCNKSYQKLELHTTKRLVMCRDCYLSIGDTRCDLCDTSVNSHTGGFSFYGNFVCHACAKLYTDDELRIELQHESELRLFKNIRETEMEVRAI